MNCMKKLLLSGSAAPRMLGSWSGVCMMRRTCWKKVLPTVPCTTTSQRSTSNTLPCAPGTDVHAGQLAEQGQPHSNKGLPVHACYLAYVVSCLAAGRQSTA
eukprot:GHUV01038607.1.p4 GENE.GHUV01038607.1~~GHUV01038607.1.p4  ORF type:complete len:101 (-),score=28.46 GHUV01038607.1:45-347(-)